jgi:hypothetical protein
MALREFTDAQGVHWRVWDLTPDDAHSMSAGPTAFHIDAFIGDYEDGWLCFESPRERRRLPHFPSDWANLPPAELERLLSQARPTPPVEADETDSGSVRRFVERRKLASEWHEGLPRRRRTDPPPD